LAGTSFDRRQFVYAGPTQAIGKLQADLRSKTAASSRTLALGVQLGALDHDAPAAKSVRAAVEQSGIVLFSAPKVEIVSPIDGAKFILAPDAARDWLVDTLLSQPCDDHAVRASLPDRLTIRPLCDVEPSIVEALGSSTTRGPECYSAAQAGAGSEIAIIGMSCRVPGAEGLDAFWELLENGLDMHQTVSASFLTVHRPSN
jgi:hypothetical protein